MLKNAHILRTCQVVTLLALLTLLAACQAQELPQGPESPTPLAAGPRATVPPVLEASHGGELPLHKGEYFTASGACSACHTGLQDEAGIDVSIDTDWRSTMMANAARDPYWQAGVQREILAFPQYQAAIEDKCTTCHAPMAHFTTHTLAGKGIMLGEEGYANPAHHLHQLAMDGVSCNLCHQITAEKLGHPDGFSGGYQIDQERPSGERIVYGPNEVDVQLASIMQAATGFAPVRGPHIQEAAMCANCHTLHTQTIDENGELGGSFPEQMPFIEWLHSDYPQSHSCQDCHMPLAQGSVKASTMSTTASETFYRHNTVAGNAYILLIFETYGFELGATASSDQFKASREQALHQLRHETAQVSLENLRMEGGSLHFEVLVTNLTGHKLPTAYPSRRAWLHLTVTDSAGMLVFESGAPNPDGSIAGNANDFDPSQYEPHYTLIDQPDQVQIYEAIMVDTLGQVTTTLLKGAAYIKDNRLLPAGFDKGKAPADIAVWGAAKNDLTFVGGGHRTGYSIPLQNAHAPYTVQVELLYQSVSYRWIENLRGHPGFEIERFLAISDTVPNTPAVAADAYAEVKP